METRGNDAGAIRAVLRDGVIYPVEPLPRGWVEGQELTVLVPAPSYDPDDIDAWHRDTEAFIDELYDLESLAEFEAAIVDVAHQAEGPMRHQRSLG